MIHRDEIHGDIQYDELAVALLDTPQLQRLGRVYQLGFGHLVYRGGTHTRLSHSMGAYYTAAHLANCLRRNYEGRTRPPEGALRPDEFLPRGPGLSGAALDGSDPSVLANRWRVLGHLVAWAGLLHDAGHVPIGHTLEDEFANIYQPHDAFGSPRFGFLWLDARSEIAAVLKSKDLYPEAFSALGIDSGEAVLKAVMLICAWKEQNTKEEGRVPFEKILDAAIEDGNKKGDRHQVRGAEELRDAIGAAGPLFHPYMADLVANTISADYLDYLRRDPHNLGLDVLRDGRIASRFWVGRDHLGQARMALSLVDRRNKPRLDTCTSVVELVRQRYRFAEIVYYHKTKVAASAMLAKVFHLLGAPSERPESRTPPTISDAEERTGALFDTASSSTRSKLLGELRTDTVPRSMLDPEIGDEGLGLLLRGKAIEIIEKALKRRDKDKERARSEAANAMRGIALLDGIARRKLYKTVFTMDPKLFPRVAGYREMPAPDRERKLREFIKKVRTDSTLRETIEEKMVAAAGWRPCSILLYVPDRKNQAKGIETGALADGTVITLGSHPAVADEVEKLSERYRALWRLIVLVHPERAGDVVGLSAAIDAFVESQFPKASLSAHGVLDAIEEGCWFPYQEQADRSAASEFAAFLARNDPGLDGWTSLREYRDAHRSGTPLQRLYGGMVLHRIKLESPPNGGEPPDTDRLLGRLGTPEELEARVQEQLEDRLASGSLTGENEANMRSRAMDEAVAQVAGELGPGG